MVFQFLLASIYRSLTEVCTTPGPYIKPNFISALKFMLSPSRNNGHAVVLNTTKHEPRHFIYRPLGHMTMICGDKINSLASCVLRHKINQPSCVARWPLCHKINQPSCVARRPLCHKINQPSCVARRPLCHKINQPSCVARRPLCHKINQPSCVARWPLCHKINQPSCVARRPLCHKINQPSCVARRPLCHKINQPSYVPRSITICDRSISETLFAKSHDQIKSFDNLVASNDVHEDRTQTPKASIKNTVCSAHISLISKNLHRGRTKENTNRKRKRDREPSRIPVYRVLKILKKRTSRRTVKFMLAESVPKTSFITHLCTNYKDACLWYNSEHYYSKYVFFMNTNKSKSGFKRCSYKQACGSVLETKPDFTQHVTISYNYYITSSLKGGVLPGNVSNNLHWACLTERLAQISLMPYDVGGSGDCFFKSVSHQLYGTAEFHFQIRMTGIAHLNNHPEFYIESVSDNTWKNYIQQMSKPGTWCDNIIIQAVSNAFNCIIHITESDINKPDGTIITPVHEGQPNTIFIGYINELHYVSSVPDNNTPSQNKNRLKNLKRKLIETEDQRKTRLINKINAYKKMKSMETDKERQKRLANTRQSVAKRRGKESVEKRQERLDKNRQIKRKAYKTIRSNETDNESQETLPKIRQNVNKQRFEESPKKTKENFETITNQKSNFEASIMEQKQVLKNIDLFHHSNEYTINQCTICLEAWPLKAPPNSLRSSKNHCLRCTRDKKHPKKFSKENNMIPSAVPCHLQGLTQVEEMLIARALPIMRVYIKPGGQRGYSDHCINLPQHIEEIATSLPRYPKDLSVIVVKMKGKDNNFKDVSVRRQNVADALHWLIYNNPHYKDVTVNQHCLNLLPENGVPLDLISVETENDDIDSSHPDVGPQNEEDILYNEQTEMSSFLPIPQCQQQEIEAVQQQLSFNHHNEHIPWPTVDNEPINEYRTPFLATLAFPALFPDGRGDPTNPSLHHDVPLAERIKHLLKYAEKKDGKWFYRFATHPRFAYWALNMIQRKRILQQTGIFLKQNPGEAHLTTEELQQMAFNNNANAFLSKISRYLSNITGSNAYWYKAKEDLKAIISHTGPPTFFFTFSSADMHWPELHALFSNDNNSTADQRRHNVINNPHITDWFFTQRLENFIKHWLYNSLDADWHWYRFEYQARGSIHCHGVAKLKNDPGLCELSEKALKGYLAEMSLHNSEPADTAELNQKILDGKKASQLVCQYVDWLLSTYNPDPPDNGTWIKPSIHPCQRRHKDILIEESHDDYIDLLNTVQRHTRCSTSYCLRRKQSETELKCRFKFPFEPCIATKLEFEPIHTNDKNSQYKANLITKRNDSRLNNHQRLQLQGWRANCDIQVVIDYHACVEYLTKYASKGEPRSPVMKTAFNSIIRYCNIQSSPTKLIKKVIMKSLGQRDFSAQETMHHLMSLKLVSSSFNVIPVSLNGSRKMKTNSPDGDVVTNDLLLDVYAKRDKFAETIPDIMTLNFITFATKYKLIDNKLAAQPHNTIPRVFPVYSSNAKGPNFPLYCKNQLISYKPWHKTQDNAWGDEPGTDELHVRTWKDFLETSYAREHVPDWYEKLHTVQNYSEHDTDIQHTPQELPQREEWMLLADLVPGSFVTIDGTQQTLHSDYDWQNDKLKYEDSQIKEMPSWLKTNKQTLAPQLNMPQENIDVSTFSDMQKYAYDIIKTHSEQSCSSDPLLLIIVGVAGTGKSYLINAIRNLLQHSCAVTATTGKASYNIQGCTIHSLLKLPIGPRNNKDLTGQGLVRLQNNLKDIKYILIDEYSMLGQKTLGWIDKRCRQATGLTNDLFGSKSIILVGDPAQLPPVADKPLYHSNPSCSIQEQGHLAYFMFNNVVKLTVNQRVQGLSPEQAQFRDLLMHLRTGDCNETDWKLLLTRQPSIVQHLADFKDATRLYYSNDEVANFNFEKLSELKQPIATINARHSSDIAKKSSPDEMSGLEPVIYLAKGAQVMLTINLWTDVGLCNGATGTILDFIYANNQQPPDLPIAVIVKFNDYTGPSISTTIPGCVPICPITVTSDTLDSVNERQQLPLKLAWAITIHKSQGLTLTKAWIDIGKSERTPGISYVAISRVRTLTSSIIEPMTFERLTGLKKSNTLKFRLQEEE